MAAWRAARRRVSPLEAEGGLWGSAVLSQRLSSVVRVSRSRRRLSDRPRAGARLPSISWNSYRPLRSAAVPMVPALLVLASATAASPIVTAVSCDLAIAGAGPGGIYSAWRYLAGHSTGNVCVFERSERHGGRIYSLKNQGPRKDLTVDVGAYRYAPEPEKASSPAAALQNQAAPLSSQCSA